MLKSRKTGRPMTSSISLIVQIKRLSSFDRSRKTVKSLSRTIKYSPENAKVAVKFVRDFGKRKYFLS